MILTIWRHGQAGSARSDRLRELTSRGRADLALGATQFRHACESRSLPLPSQVLHSAWLRTTQTADIIGGALCITDITTAAALLPGGLVQATDACLQQVIDRTHVPEHLLLISHQPLVSQLVDHYLGESAGPVPPMAPGGLTTLSLEVPASACAQLLFWASPPHYEACL